MNKPTPHKPTSPRAPKPASAASVASPRRLVAREVAAPKYGPRRKAAAGADDPKEGTRHVQHLLASHRFADLYAASAIDRIAMVKQGIPAQEVGRLADALATPRENLYRWLGLPRQTVARKAKESKPLSPQEGERLLGVARLVGQLEVMVRESGDPEGFDAAAWLVEWIEQPQPALGGGKPADLMDTNAGQGIVSQLLAQSQSSAYA